MHITSSSDKKIGTSAKTVKSDDLLDAVKINSMGHIIAVDRNGSKYDVETICVETGVMRVNVCGQIDVMDYNDYSYFIDQNGTTVIPDDLVLEGGK